MWYHLLVMPEIDRAEVRVGRQGRLVIPAALRRELSIGPGDRLVARVVNGRLILEPRERVWEAIKQRFAAASGGSSLVDELLAERRAEARREGGG